MSKVVDIVNEIIIKKIEEEGLLPWQKPWSSYGMPKNLFTQKEYRGVNPWILMSKNFDSPFWLTSKQATEHGGKIKRECWKQYTPIVFLNRFTKEVENRNGEMVEKSIPFLRFYQGYNYEQTEGLEKYIPEIKTHSHNPIECCENTIKAMPNAPKINFSGEKACYIPSQDKIKIPALNRFNSPEEYYSTLFHELVHSTGHETRLDRDLKTLFGSESYSKEELIAEFGAAYLCGNCQIENKTINNSAAYIKGWLSKLKDDRKLLISAASMAQKATDYILDKEI
jgi:antirestriction protein ArdC